jgi:hypothetical protein
MIGCRSLAALLVASWMSAGLLAVDGLARHANGRGYRIQRQHGHEQPEQQCLERSIHLGKV